MPPNLSHGALRLISFGVASRLIGSLALALAWHGMALAFEASQPKVSKAKDDPAQRSTLVAVTDAWVRATVKGQTASGGYMSLTASQDLKLVGFSSPVASETELHEMVMEGSVMRMRALDALALPAGQTVVLKPGAGGQHLMLMGLKEQLVDGKEIAVTLKLRTAKGKSLTQQIKVPVKAQRRAAVTSLSASAPHGSASPPAGYAPSH